MMRGDLYYKVDGKGKITKINSKEYVLTMKEAQEELNRYKKNDCIAGLDSFLSDGLLFNIFGNQKGIMLTKIMINKVRSFHFSVEQFDKIYEFIHSNKFEKDIVTEKI